MTTHGASSDDDRFANAVRDRLAAPQNPLTVIFHPLAWRSLAYCFTSIFMGGFALLAGILGFPVLPRVLSQTATLERRRLHLLGIHYPEQTRHPGGLAVWGITVLFALVDALPGALIVAALAVGASGVLGSGNSFSFQVLMMVWSWAWLTAGAYVAWALASAQANAVISASAPPEAERQVAELTSSRSELVDVFEAERRRIERDLHDGAQQHLVVSTMQLGEAVYWLDQERTDSARQAVLAAHESIETALASLRDTIRGIHPQVLTDRGLVAAVQELAANQPLPVTVRVSGAQESLPAGVQNAAYYVTSEALTNVVRHAGATEASVRLDFSGRLLLQISDNGRGGAVPRSGHGLSGLAERVHTAGGTFELTSPPGGPTLLSATFPYAGRS